MSDGATGIGSGWLSAGGAVLTWSLRRRGNPNALLPTGPPGTERGEGLVVAAPAGGGFVDAAGESQALAMAVFNDAFLGVEDGAVVGHLPVVEGQGHTDLQMAMVHQPGQQFSPQGPIILVPRLHVPEWKRAHQVITQYLLHQCPTGNGGNVLPAEENTGNQPHPTVPAPIRRCGHLSLELLKRRFQGWSASPAMVRCHPSANRIIANVPTTWQSILLHSGLERVPGPPL